MTFIIPCTRTKNNPLDYIECQPSMLENLSFNEELNEIRQNLIQETYPAINWNYCLPAWKLYAGRLYVPVIEENWVKNADIKIVSALFGIIRHTDLIPNYDLNINKVYAFWRNVNLNIFIDENNDIDLLSGNYRRAFNITGDPIAHVPQVWTESYGTQRGNWLNNQLNNL